MILIASRAWTPVTVLRVILEITGGCIDYAIKDYIVLL